MKPFFQRLTSLGNRPENTDKEKQQHMFLILMGVFMSGGGLVWGGITSYFGLYAASLIPFGYTFFTFWNLWLFSGTKNFGLVGFIQVSMSLLLPFFLQWALGGLIASGGVMIWSLMALVGSFTFQNFRQSLGWLIGFVALVVFSGVMDDAFHFLSYHPTPEVSVLLFTINIALVSAMVLGLMIYQLWELDQSAKRLEEGSKVMHQSEKKLETANLQLIRLIGEVKRMGQKINEASHQISNSADHLSGQATNQAASLEETSATLTLLAGQTNENASHAQNASRMALDVTDKVESGARLMDNVISHMNMLTESSNQISEIIQAIDDISFQTNLLALNAAVEAGRAGVHGRGFAVVAAEVRALAEKSTQAAKDTTRLLENSLTEIEQSSLLAKKMADFLGDIRQTVGVAAGKVQEISLAVSDQANGLNQIKSAIRQVESITSQTSATAEENAAVARELESQIHGLNQLLGRVNSSVFAQSGSSPGALMAVAVSHSTPRNPERRIQP
ncbi:MAG: methyl-accepting chemotaxis protein [Deltaproteobacteria bacterium]|nr:methyl-accepting chemotaxis protein [Deltaproteobacteria bacterium]